MFSGVYTISVPPPTQTVTIPTAAPPPGTFTAPPSVSLFSDQGATICFTTNGGTPAATTPPNCNAGSTPYSGPITLFSTSTIKAIGTRAGYINSALFTGLYTITTPPVVIVIGSVEIRPAPGVSITDARVVNGHVSFSATTTQTTSAIATVVFKGSSMKYQSCGVIANGEATPHGLSWTTAATNQLVISTSSGLRPGEMLSIHLDCWTS
jgi:hypothetical protein